MVFPVVKKLPLVFDVARAKNAVLFSVLQNKTDQNVTRWKPAPISKNRHQGQMIKKSTQYDWWIIFLVLFLFLKPGWEQESLKLQNKTKGAVWFLCLFLFWFCFCSTARINLTNIKNKIKTVIFVFSFVLQICQQNWPPSFVFFAWTKLQTKLGKSWVLPKLAWDLQSCQKPSAQRNNT